MNIDRVSGITTVLLFLSCSIAPTRADVDLKGDVAYYTGEISVEQNRRLFELVQNKPVTRLVITSGGGDVEAGIELGSWVFGRTVDIEVPQYCLSSCANYVFPAARFKSIAAGAVVAWHGNYHHLEQTGLWRDDVASRMRRFGEDVATATRHVRAQVDHLVQLEDEFFSRIGVDELLCWIGKQAPYNAPDYYFLSASDMGKFGVSDVETPVGYDDADPSGFDGSITFVRLKD